MTEAATKQLLAERLRALATVVLTRIPELTLAEARAETGLDLLVTIDREDKSMRLVFGVLLRSASSPVSAEQVNALLAPTVRQFQGMRKFTYPVCLFAFTTGEEQAWFTWLAEPVVDGGAPKLRHRSAPHWVELTDVLLAKVLEQVVAWYDAVETVLIA